MIYVEQVEGYGLGNFINLTPTLRQIHEDGEKIMVYFRDDHIKECFIDCPFFKISNIRQPEPIMLHSGMINRHNSCPDYEFVWRMFIETKNVTQHTYVDTPTSGPKFKEPYTVVINGTGPTRKDYVAKKQIPPVHYNKILGNGLIIGVGSEGDHERLKGIRVDHFVTGMRNCLYVIAHAKRVISNDCGLSHAAAAMNKDLTIFWKDTLRPKNLSPGKHTKNIQI